MHCRALVRAEDGRWYVPTDNKPEENVGELTTLVDEGLAATGAEGGKGGDDEGAARSPAYICAVSYDLGMWFFDGSKLSDAERWFNKALSLVGPAQEGVSGSSCGELCEVDAERSSAATPEPLGQIRETLEPAYCEFLNPHTRA